MITNREILAAIMSQFSTLTSVGQITPKQASWIVVQIGLKMGFIQDEMDIMTKELDEGVSKAIWATFKSQSEIFDKSN